MTIELYKGEDELLLSLLGEEYKKLGLDENVRARQIYRLIERIELTQKLYRNMYGRELKEHSTINNPWFEEMKERDKKIFHSDLQKRGDYLE